MDSIRTSVLLLGLAVITVGLPSTAAADAIVITPADDARGIDAFGPDLFPDGIFEHLQTDFGLAYASRNSSFEERPAMEFALAAISEGATILSATLSLFSPNPPAFGPQSIEVHGYTGNGVVEVTDLNVTHLLSSVVVNANTVSIAIPPDFLQELLLADADFAGLVLRNVTIPSGVFEFYSMGSEFGNSGFPELNPRLDLEVNVVPEPGSFVLLGTALAALAGRRACRLRKSGGRS